MGAGAARSQGGVALAIVVWFIAGMSLLVAGIVSRAAVDTRMAQLHLARAKVSAAGDGAVQLVMLELVSGKLSTIAQEDGRVIPYRLGDVEVEVSLVPTAGLIDLNAASPEVLAALFVVATGVNREQAQRLADNVINWRISVKRLMKDKVSTRFREVEDILRVDGINRAQLDGIRGYVVAGNAAQGSHDWVQSPGSVLAVLQELDAGRYDAVIQRRMRVSENAGGAQPGRAQAGGGAFRADVVVRYGDRTWLRRHWVMMESGQSSLLPWRIVRTEAARVIAG